MNGKEALLQGWDAAYGKEDWYPPLADALSGLSVEQATWRPAGERVNTIWETVMHLIFYKERYLKRLTGEENGYPEGLTNDGTFAIPEPTDENWTDSLTKLKAIHFGIRDRLANMEEDRLNEKIPQTEIGAWALSLSLHDAYHAGQIILLRKLQGSWPSRRSFE